MHNGENAFEVLLFLYKQCKHHAQNVKNASITHKMRFLCINRFILETCHICMDSLIISLHGNVNNSKFIKKIPLNLDQPSPLNLFILIYIVFITLMMLYF